MSLTRRQKIIMKKTSGIVTVTRNWVSNGTSLKYIKNGDHVFQDLLGKKKFFTKFMKFKSDQEIINFVIGNANSPWYDLATNRVYSNIISELIILDYHIIKKEKMIKKKNLSKKSKAYKSLKKEERLYDKTIRNLRKALGLKKKEAIPDFDNLKEFNNYSKNGNSYNSLSEFGYIDAFDAFDIESDEDESKYSLNRNNIFDIFDVEDEDEDDYDDEPSTQSVTDRKLDVLIDSVQSLANAIGRNSVQSPKTFDIEDEDDDYYDEEEDYSENQNKIYNLLAEMAERQNRTDQALSSVIDLITEQDDDTAEYVEIPVEQIQSAPVSFREDTTEELIDAVNSIKNSTSDQKTGVVIDTETVETVSVETEV